MRWQKQVFIHTRLSRAYLALARLSCILYVSCFTRTYRNVQLQCSLPHVSEQKLRPWSVLVDNIRRLFNEINVGLIGRGTVSPCRFLKTWWSWLTSRSRWRNSSDQQLESTTPLKPHGLLSCRQIPTIMYVWSNANIFLYFACCSLVLNVCNVVFTLFLSSQNTNNK